MKKWLGIAIVTIAITVSSGSLAGDHANSKSADTKVTDGEYQTAKNAMQCACSSPYPGFNDPFGTFRFKRWGV